MKQEIVKENGKRYMKVKKGEYYDKKKSRKMKKHHPVRWILISAFCLLIVAPVGFIFGAFYDSSTRNIDDTYEKFDTKLVQSMTDGLKNLSIDNPNFTMTLGKDFTSSLLASVNEKIAEQPNISKFIKKMYCDIDGNTWTFYVEAQFSFFKTKLILITEMGSEERNGVETYVFKIKNLILGRLPLANLAKGLIPKFIDPTSLNNIFASTPLKNAKLDINNLEITYPVAGMKEDLGNVLFSSQIRTDNAFANIILSLYDNLFPKVDFNNGLSISLGLGGLKELPTTFKSSIREQIFNNNDYKMSEHIKFAEQQLNAGNIAEADLSKLMTCIIAGYKDDYASIFNNANLAAAFKTEYMIDDPKNYTGLSFINNNRIKEIKTAIKPKTIVLSTITSLLDGTPLNVFDIEDTVLTKYFRSTPIVGNSTVTTFTGENNTKYITNVMFDDFVFNVNTDNNVQIYTDINMNGLQIPFSIDGTFESSNQTNGTIDRSFAIAPNKVYVGPFEIDSSLVLDYIGSVMTDSGFFSIKKSEEGNYKFVINTSTFQIEETGDTQVIACKKMVNQILRGDSEIDDPTDSSKPKISGEKFGIKVNSSNKKLSFTLNYSK